MRNKSLSYALVTIQFGALLVLALTGPILASGFWLVVEGAALLLGLWAILAMRIGNFNITPQPKEGAQLIAIAPYRWIRHPMYLSLIVGGAALVANSFSWVRLFIWIVLTLDLLFKLNFEERLLIHHFIGYEQLRHRSWRLIPFVY